MREELTKEFRRVWNHLAIAGKCDAIDSAEYTRIHATWMQSACPSNIETFIVQHSSFIPPRIDVDDQTKTPLLDTMERLASLTEDVERWKLAKQRGALISSFITMAVLYTFYGVLVLISAKVLHHAWRLLTTGAL
jgi:hypothetical protein